MYVHMYMYRFEYIYIYIYIYIYAYIDSTKKLMKEKGLITPKAVKGSVGTEVYVCIYACACINVCM